MHKRHKLGEALLSDIGVTCNLTTTHTFHPEGGVNSFFQKSKRVGLVAKGGVSSKGWGAVFEGGVEDFLL